MNAGHRPILRYRDGAVTEFGVVHRPWLGVDANLLAEPSTVDVAPDDVLLLFTDGLVEERREPIDHRIRERLHRLDTSIELSAMVDSVIDERTTHRSTTSVDDDRSDRDPATPWDLTPSNSWHCPTEAVDSISRTCWSHDGERRTRRSAWRWPAPGQLGLRVG